MSRMLIIPRYLDLLKARFGNLNIVETGTIRNTEPKYHRGDGWSTFYIATWVKKNGGATFTSIDLNIAESDRFLKDRGLREVVKLVEGDSRDVLPTLGGRIHFALLDSANDKQLILDEFKLIEGRTNIVMVDDVTNEPGVVKGDLIIPYAKERGYGVELLPRIAIIRLGA